MTPSRFVCALLLFLAAAAWAQAPAPPAPGAAADEDPARSAEIRALMDGVGQGADFAKIRLLPEGQRRKIWAYFQQGKTTKTRPGALGMGVGALVRGFGAVEDVRKFVAAYRESGKKLVRLPSPDQEFAAAAKMFPEADKAIAQELATAQKMAGELATIRASYATAPDRQAVESDRMAADGFRRAADRYRQSIEPGGAEEAVKKSVEAVDKLLKEFPQG